MNSSESARRAYSSPLRARQARATRWAVLRAAERLFADRGYTRTSIDDIARAAGVSRATVASAVGPKPRLLKEAYDTALAGDDDPQPVTQRESARKVAAQPDAHAVLVAYAEHASAICARVAGIAEAVRGAAGADADARALWEETGRQRLTGARIAVERVLAVGELRPGLDPATATDIVWTFNDATLYHSLVHVRGWSHERYRAWLAETLVGQLLGQSP